MLNLNNTPRSQALSRLFAACIVCLGWLPMYATEPSVKVITDPIPVFSPTNDSSSTTSMQYIVGYASGPVEMADGDRVVSLKDINGTQYSCVIPPSNSSSNELSKAENSDGSDGIEEPTPEEILDTLRNFCSYRVEDSWWTYEICYKKQIRQYHMEKKTITTEYILGIYSDDESDINVIRTDTSSTQGSVTYVSQHYTDGADCELTGGKRQSEVRYICGTASETLLVSVREAQSCSYVFTLATPLLCSHSAFKAKERPVLAIKCYKHDEAESESGSCDVDL